MKKSKEIIDVACGSRMFYFNKEDERVLFQDIRSFETQLCDGRQFEVKPDVIGDFRKMDYPDGSFKLVIFDPPHLLRNVGNSKFDDIYGSLNAKDAPSGYQHIKYGALGNRDWRETIKLGFKECFRILANGGFLIFKWSEIDIKVSEILKLTEYKPIIGHKSGKRSLTHWILFQK